MKNVLVSLALMGGLAICGSAIAQDRTPPTGASTGADAPPIDQSPRGAAAAARAATPEAPVAQGLQTPNAPAAPEFKNR